MQFSKADMKNRNKYKETAINYVCVTISLKNSHDLIQQEMLNFLNLSQTEFFNMKDF